MIYFEGGDEGFATGLDMRWERIRRVKVCSLKNWKDGLPLIEVRGGESSFLVFGR